MTMFRSMKSIDVTRALVVCACVVALSSCAGATKGAKPAPPPAAVVVPPPPTAAQTQAPPAREPVVVQGTGTFVGTPSSQRTSLPPAGDGYQLTFVDTEISSVVATVNATETAGDESRPLIRCLM